MFLPSPPINQTSITTSPKYHHLSLSTKLTIMQQAIPYKSWLPLYTNTNLGRRSPALNHVSPVEPAGGNTKDVSIDMKNMVSENAVIVFGKRGCCMSHVVKRLLLGLGVNPAVHEVSDEDEVGVVGELETIAASAADQNGLKPGRMQFPAVFIGGRLFGGLDRVMATHITGELVPILKEAGALWL